MDTSKGGWIDKWTGRQNNGQTLFHRTLLATTWGLISILNVK